jgi:phage host-nuclease inhibitor protein Gam
MKMKTRIKKPQGATLTRADVEVMMHELRTLAQAEQKILADKNAAIRQIDASCAPALASIVKQRKPLVAAIQQWAEAHPEEFAKRKSIEMTHGTVGFRTGTPKLALLNRKWNWQSALEAVMHLLPAFIRNSPEIDKEALIAQRADDAIAWALPRCGLKVTQDEGFFVDPKLEQVETRKTNVTPLKEAA